MALYFKKGIPVDDATRFTKTYRDNYPDWIRGVCYTKDQINDYITKFFDHIGTEQPHRNDGYTIAIGFYHAVNDDGKLIILVAPVWVNDTPPAGMAKVLDFYANFNEFNTNVKEPGTIKPGFVYDEGQLWP